MSLAWHTSVSICLLPPILTVDPLLLPVAPLPHPLAPQAPSRPLPPLIPLCPTNSPSVKTLPPGYLAQLVTHLTIPSLIQGAPAKKCSGLAQGPKEHPPLAPACLTVLQFDSFEPSLSWSSCSQPLTHTQPPTYPKPNSKPLPAPWPTLFPKGQPFSASGSTPTTNFA